MAHMQTWEEWEYSENSCARRFHSVNVRDGMHTQPNKNGWWGGVSDKAPSDGDVCQCNSHPPTEYRFAYRNGIN